MRKVRRTRFSTREHATKNLVDSPAGICTERAQEKNSRHESFNYGRRWFTGKTLDYEDGKL
jgi:hypothetical protein